MVIGSMVGARFAMATGPFGALIAWAMAGTGEIKQRPAADKEFQRADVANPSLGSAPVVGRGPRRRTVVDWGPKESSCP